MMSFRHDLVDVTRQGLQLSMDAYYALYLRAYRQKKLLATREISKNILQLFDDMDELLASDEHFLLGKWLYDAKSLGVTPVEKRYYEYNARNQITLWGPNGEVRRVFMFFNVVLTMVLALKSSLYVVYGNKGKQLSIASTKLKRSIKIAH